jgi:hypothetical protein
VEDAVSKPRIKPGRLDWDDEPVTITDVRERMTELRGMLRDLSAALDARDWDTVEAIGSDLDPSGSEIRYRTDALIEANRPTA